MYRVILNHIFNTQRQENENSRLFLQFHFNAEAILEIQEGDFLACIIHPYVRLVTIRVIMNHEGNDTSLYWCLQCDPYFTLFAR